MPPAPDSQHEMSSKIYDSRAGSSAVLPELPPDISSPSTDSFSSMGSSAPNGDSPVIVREAIEAPPGADGDIEWRMSTASHFYLMRLVCMTTLCTGLSYLGWKTFTVFSDISEAGPTCIIFLSTELLVFICSFMLVLETSVPARKRPGLLLPESGPYPQVAMFICCCNEPVDVIQDTVRGALAQIYPVDKYTVWVLDDGGDDVLKEWVESEGAEQGGRLRYVRRPKPKGLPHHFKAGNINWGLRVAGGDFVAIFDADMIPSKYYLRSMLPHFTSADIAFVQCPQAFYNIVKGDPLNDASQDFYDVFLPYRDGRDSAQCVGTGVLIRKEALQANHGFTCGSITEDFDTAMSLHAKGYKTVYINQRLQAGITPWNLEGYIKQHQRWATGSLQILFHRNPLFYRSKNFNLYRRISYWYAGTQYYMNIVVLLILTLPILILAFNLRIMVHGEAYTVQRLYVILLVPYVISSRILCLCLFARLPNGMPVQLRGEQVWYWMAYFNCLAIFKFLFPLMRKTFEATGSTKKRPVTMWTKLSTVWFHIVYCICGILVVVYRLATTNFHDCGLVLKVTSWSPFILFSVQCMSVPIFYQLNSGSHPKAANRRQMLTYDDQGVATLRPEQLKPPQDKAVGWYFFLPGLWGSVVLFYFFVAISDWSPDFCTISGFYGYKHF